MNKICVKMSLTTLLVLVLIASVTTVVSALDTPCAIYGSIYYNDELVSGSTVTASSGSVSASGSDFKIDSVPPGAAIDITATYNGHSKTITVNTPSEGGPVNGKDIRITYTPPTPTPTPAPTPEPTAHPVNGGVFAFDTATAYAQSGIVTVNVIRMGSIDSAASVELWIGGTTTAAPGTDFTLSPSAPVTLSFSPGDSMKSVTVNLVGDYAGKAPETIVLLLASPSDGASITNPQVYTLTVGDQKVTATPTPTAMPSATPTASLTATATPTPTPTPTPVPESSTAPTPTPVPASAEQTSANWYWLLVLALIPIVGIVGYFLGAMRNK